MLQRHKMKVEEQKFQGLVGLLKKNDSVNGLIAECLEQTNDELSFSFFSEDGKTDKNHVLRIYRIRANVEKNRPKNPFVIGYDQLLPKLISSDLDFINTSSITTEKASYIILSDYDYKEFVGILKSKKTLTEEREKTKEQDHCREWIFINGRLKK